MASTAPLKVLIVGGGIAGPALAYWLSRLGAAITVIARAADMRASGQQLDLRAQGVPLMKKMGIEAAVDAALVREPGTQFIDTRGRVQAFFPATGSGSAKQSITSDYEIMRGSQVRILHGLTEDTPNVRYLFNTTIDTFTQDDVGDPDGKVHVTLSDGRREDFALVVGADGTRSKTRRIMLGPDAPDPRRPRGGYIGFFSAPPNPKDSDRGTFCHLPGKVSRAILTRKDCPEFTRVYLLMHGKDEALEAAHESGDLAALKKAWADLYEDGGWECGRFAEALRHSPAADDLYSTPTVEVALPKGSWSRGRVVRVGDAAHSQTANGFGTTWGLVGSYILAGEIATLLLGKDGGSSSPTEAVMEGAKRYEEIFRPISTVGFGDVGEKFESLAFPKSSFAIWILHKFAKLAAYFRLDQRISQGKENAKWQLPEYPVLEKGQQQE